MYSRAAQNYSLRLMACLVLALLLAIACFRIPIRQDPHPVGWTNPRFAHSDGLILVELLREEVPQIAWDAQTNTTGSSAERHHDRGEESARVALRDTASAQSAREAVTEKLPVLDHAELMPAIPGGIGAYYVHIEYPQEAIEQGIEGQLQLTFTVNTDGSTSHIRVTQPLHPLCDSAAVQALRRTRFIPGQHDGRSVRVRMRLPVRFQLIDPSPEPKLSSESAPQ